MEVAMLRTTMVLLHLLHTPVIFYQDQWAEVVLSRAPHAALEGCSSMQTAPPGFYRKRGRTTREVNLTLCTRTIDYRGVSSSSDFFFHLRVVFRQQVLEAAHPEDRAPTTIA